MATTTKTTPFTFIKTVKKTREVSVEKVEQVEKEENPVTYMEPFFSCEAAEKVLRKKAQPKRANIFARNLY